VLGSDLMETETPVDCLLVLHFSLLSCCLPLRVYCMWFLWQAEKRDREREREREHERGRESESELVANGF